MVKDPVCKMEIEKEKAAGTSEYKGKIYYFCSESCRTSFDEDPLAYAESSD